MGRGGSSLAPPSPTPPATAQIHCYSAEKSQRRRQRLSASRCWDWLPKWKRAESFTSSPALPLRLSYPPAPPGEQVRRLHFAAAAGLLLLRLDVVVDLELGLVGLLRRSVLQLPGRHTDGETERERYSK